MLHLSASLTLLLLSAVQVPGQPATPRMPVVDMTTRYGTTPSEYQSRFAAQLNDPTRGNLSVDNEREELIGEVAPLVAEGRCEAARQRARAAGDRALSRRIGQVCVEGRPTPMEPASPAGS